MSDRLPQLISDFKAEGLGQWIKSEQDERALLAGFTFQSDLGQYVVDFFPAWFRHFKDRFAGKPFVLDTWQRDDIVMPLFSWVHKDTGLRRFNSLDVWVAKKNGKSMFASGLGLYILVAEHKEGPEVYAVANDRDQASIVYGSAADMVEASPGLRRRLVVRRHNMVIRYGTSAWFKALSGEHRKQHGLNPYMVIIDEIHAFNGRGAELFKSLYYGDVMRMQPLRIIISTAGDDEHTIGYERYEYARSVLKGETEDITSLVFIAEPEKEDDWKKPATWAKANPGFGTIIREDEMAQKCAEAQASPAMKAQFEQLRLNRWVATANPWFDMAKWDACGHDIDEDELEGMECVGGLDLASVLDLVAFVLAFPHEDGDVTILPWFFMPEEQLHNKDAMHRGGADLGPWVREGFITVTPGAETDHAFVKRTILECQSRFALGEIVYDDWNIGNMNNDLEGEGITMIKCPQNLKQMNRPSKKFEALVVGGKLRHSNNPVMNWMARNVCIYENANQDIRPVKQKRKTGKKIDGIIAAIMAVGRTETIDMSEPVITVLA